MQLIRPSTVSLVQPPIETVFEFPNGFGEEMKLTFKRTLSLTGAFALGAMLTIGQPMGALADAAAKDGAAKDAKPHAGGRREGKGGPLQAAIKELGLTDAQKAQVKEIMAANRPKMKAIRDDATLDRKAKREQQKALLEESITKVRAILTAEQQAKFDTLVAEAKAKRAAQGGRKGQKKAE